MTFPENTQSPQNPQNYSDYYREGWLLHSDGKQEQAETAIRKALALQPEAVDGHYVLGLILKTQGRNREAVETFEKTLELLERGLVQDATRKAMLRRLTKGHINRIQTGDWNLEKEIWHRTGEENL
jgi:tetratricopeptide (TPR) repeat protein